MRRRRGRFVVELDGQAMPPFSLASTRSDGDQFTIWLVRDRRHVVAEPFVTAILPEKAQLARGRSRRRFATGLFSSSEQRGTSEENAWSLARARFDAETFWYRGNGSVDIVSDARFLEPGREQEFRDRNVILYGHAENNAAWPVLLGASPVQVRRGQVKVGSRTVTRAKTWRASLSGRGPAATWLRSGGFRIGLDRPPAHRTAAVFHLGRGLSRLPGVEGRGAARKLGGPDRSGLFRSGLGCRIGRICLARLNGRSLAVADAGILADRPCFGVLPSYHEVIAAS